MGSAALPVPEGGTARRRYARYQLAIPFDVTVFRPGNVVRLSGRSQDIGEGGLCGVISGAALPGERVELTLVLPTSPEPLNMHAEVRYESGLHCGFEFLSLEHNQREQLQQLGADPAVRASLINETEWEPELEPPPHQELAVCPACGQEVSEGIRVCIMCGASLSPELDEETGEPAALAAGPEPATAPALPPPRKEGGKAHRGPVLDSVVAVVFLVTLTIGLWQWMHSPADADSDSRPSPVTIELEHVFLRPAPASIDQASAAARSRSSAVLSAATSVVSAVIGSASPREEQGSVGTPGSAAGEISRRREPPPVSNSNINSAQRSVPPVSSPSLSNSPAPAPPAPAPANDLSAQSSSAPENRAAQNSSAAENSAAASAPASEAPSSADLAGMLLQKVLPVYPARARRDGVQGQVVLKAVIGKDGTIAELRPLQGPQELTAAAIDAVQHWRFRPYELQGKPVEVETDIRLNFQLPNKK